MNCTVLFTYPFYGSNVLNTGSSLPACQTESARAYNSEQLS